VKEFDLINTYFKPLAKGFPGSLNLTDDAAVLDIPAGFQLIITKDAISQGVHFIGNEAPSLIAKKLLRTNLSDLAAKGTTPYCYFLAGMLPKNTDEAWIKSFTSGLAEDQKLFGIHLAGGDTTSTLGSLSLSITALGLVPKNSALTRSRAKIGDDIYVSGTLGDSALGLLSAQGKCPHDAFLINRYQLPEPRLSLGQTLRGIANSCMDISDGLVQDLEHICKASNVGAVIEAHTLPLSAAAQKIGTLLALEAALSGGDDYELLFTVAPENAKNIAALAKKFALPIARIGKIANGKKVRVIDESGKEIDIEKKGFLHF
jgi:thiamine-monophosphate kinase